MSSNFKKNNKIISSGISPPPPIYIKGGASDLPPNDKEMPLVEHLEELRQRVINSFIALLVTASLSLLFVKPIVRLLEAPAGPIRFLQVAPGEFLFVSIKVAGYTGLIIALPFIIYQGLAFILPGLTVRERRLIGPAVAGSAILFLIGIIFAWSVLIPAALGFLVSYGSEVVEPIWSIERYLDFVLVLMLATGLAFQVPILQLILGFLGLIKWKKMLSAWRLVVITAALAGAILTPSTDPITMLLMTSAISILFLIGVGLVAITEQIKLKTP